MGLLDRLRGAWRGARMGWHGAPAPAPTSPPPPVQLDPRAEYRVVIVRRGSSRVIGPCDGRAASQHFEWESRDPTKDVFIEQLIDGHWTVRGRRLADDGMEEGHA